jgi:hypothetical protein
MPLNCDSEADLRARAQRRAIDREQPRQEIACQGLVLLQPGGADVVVEHIVPARIAALRRAVRIQHQPGLVVILEQRVERFRRQRDGSGKRQQQQGKHALDAHEFSIRPDSRWRVLCPVLWERAMPAMVLHRSRARRAPTGRARSHRKSVLPQKERRSYTVRLR